MGGLKWYPKITRFESRLLRAIPKATLFVVARQLAAQVLGHCDEFDGAADHILDEWIAQFNARNVPQKPPRFLCNGGSWTDK